MRRYLINILISIDQLGNTLLGGDPDETISSRMGKHVEGKRCRFCQALCRLLHRLDPHHCRDAIERDEGEAS